MVRRISRRHLLLLVAVTTTATACQSVTVPAQSTAPPVSPVGAPVTPVSSVPIAPSPSDSTGPVPSTSVASDASPEDVVAEYFAALTGKRSADAYARLTPALRSRTHEDDVAAAAEVITSIEVAAVQAEARHGDRTILRVSLTVTPVAGRTSAWNPGVNVRWIDVRRTAEGWRIDQIASSPVVPTTSAPPGRPAPPVPATPGGAAAPPVVMADAQRVVMDYFSAIGRNQVAVARAQLTPDARQQITEASLAPLAAGLRALEVRGIHPAIVAPDRLVYRILVEPVAMPDKTHNWVTGSTVQWVELRRTADGWRINQVTTTPLG